MMIFWGRGDLTGISVDIANGRIVAKVIGSGDPRKTLVSYSL